MQILSVEDDDDHAEIVSRSLAAHRVANRIHRVSDGDAALNYLFRLGPYADPARSPRPHLVLLDLRLPKIDGLEVLRRVKSSPGLRSIPVVMLTTSSAERDVVAAYECHANSYLVKPLDYEEFSQMMESLGFFWLSWNHSTAEGTGAERTG